MARNFQLHLQYDCLPANKNLGKRAEKFVRANDKLTQVLGPLPEGQDPVGSAVDVLRAEAKADLGSQHQQGTAG